MHDLFVNGISIHRLLGSENDDEPFYDVRMLFFPELRTLGTRPDRIQKHQIALAEKLVARSDADDLPRRIAPSSEISAETLQIDVAPVGEQPGWREPIRLTFHYLHWEEDDKQIGFVPVLDIEVIAKTGGNIADLIRQNINAALDREKVRHSLIELLRLHTEEEPHVQRFEWNAYPMSPKERHLREEGEDGNEDALKEAADRISADRSPETHAFCREAEIDRIARSLSRRRSSGSLLLVGENGVGKTRIADHVAARRNDLGLGKRDFFRTSGSRIIAGMCGFGEWQDRCRAIAEEAGEKNAVLLFGNLLELIQVGQHSSSSESIASYFRPHLVRGEFCAIAECTPAELAAIEQEDPRILEAFRQIPVEPLSAEDSLRAAKSLHEVTTTYRPTSPEARRRALTHHQRYAGYSALPGRYLRFLDRLRRVREENPVDESEVDLAFAEETGLPDFLLSRKTPFSPGKTESWFRERIIGQHDAIGPVVDNIAAIRNRLTRPGKPLASFLFIGPTGVGKTELAKAIAEFFYGSRGKLARFDMSEFSTPGSGARLVSGAVGESEGILTAKMRDEPFSVVLLDEFEKAHSSVHDLFLQVLGEGRLTDAAGRLADFSNAIIILTSNLGAAEFNNVAPGFHDSETGQKNLAIDHFTEAVKKRVRPEFFNRIDRIVPFHSLSQDSIALIVRRELAELVKRDGFQSREIQVKFGDGITGRLAAAGYDARYGARSLKRAIEEMIITPIAKQMTSRKDWNRSEVTAQFESPSADELSFTVTPLALRDASSRLPESKVKKSAKIRRLYHRLIASSLFGEFQGILKRTEAAIKQDRSGQSRHRLALLEKISDRVNERNRQAMETEEQLILADFESATNGNPPEIEPDSLTEIAFKKDLVDIYQSIKETGKSIALVLTADSMERLCEGGRVYRDLAKLCGWRCALGYYQRNPDEDLRDPKNKDRWAPVPLAAGEVDDFFIGANPNCVALAIHLTSSEAARLLDKEAGIHLRVDEKSDKHYLRVMTFPDEAFTIEQGYLDDCTLLDRNFADQWIRRQWREDKLKYVDSCLDDGTRLPISIHAETLRDLLEMLQEQDAFRAMDA